VEGDMIRARRGAGSDDAGSIVLGWLTKLVLLFAMLGVLLFDGIAIAVNNMTAQDEANMAAQAAADTYKATHDLQAAYSAAVAAVADKNEKVLTRSFVIAADGSVHLVLRRETTTLVMHHIGALQKYERAEASGEAAAPPS
jgi:hypothetical protein